jgi:hypothetical protein
MCDNVLVIIIAQKAQENLIIMVGCHLWNYEKWLRHE